MDTREQILAKAEELFLNYGIRSITMDDFAARLGISKKTLYQHVADKNDLVSQTIQNHLMCERDTIQKIREEHENAIDEIFEIGKHVIAHLSKTNPSTIYDLQKYHPDGWKLFIEHKNSFVYSCILENIQNGVKQELYRDDFNPDIIARFYAARTDLVVNQEIFPFPKYSVMDVYSEYLKYHVRAIASAKGLKYLEKQKLI